MKLIFLTEQFYEDFSSYKEIETKKNRPYIMILVCYNNLDFAIPLRSYIPHKHFFKTTKTTNKGIDYTKSIIITDTKYISSVEPNITQDEFDNIKFNEYKIKTNFIKYIELYIKTYNKIQSGNFHPREKIICNFSTLQNYHKELNI